MHRTRMLALLLTACAGEAADPGDLTVTREVAADTTFITINGDVPPAEVRQFVEEMAIAPGADDISLFTTVREFDVDQWGRMWVFDNDTRSILVFDADGTLVRRVGRRGAGPGEFGGNSGMVILPSGGLAIWDSGNARVSFFDSTGAFLESWRLPPGFFTTGGLLADSGGQLYMRRPITPSTGIGNVGRSGLVEFLPGGEIGDSIAPPVMPRERHMYTAEAAQTRMSMGATYGAGGFWSFTSAGAFVVADGETYRITIVPRTGRPIVIARSPSPVPVDAEERAIEEAQMIWTARRTQPEWTWSGPPLPTVKAPLVGLRVGRDGQIWARVAVPSELIPDAELTPPTDSTRPVTRHRMPHVFEVFTADGNLLGRVAVPPRTQIMESDGNLVWAIVTDEDGLPAVVRFRIEPGFTAGK